MRWQLVIMAIAILKAEDILGKSVRLKEPYKPDYWAMRYGLDFPGYEHGVVVQVLSWHTDRRHGKYVQRVSLHLFDRLGHLYLLGNRSGVPLPAFVDFATEELILCRADMTVGEDLR
jgi:hypothetical protein